MDAPRRHGTAQWMEPAALLQRHPYAPGSIWIGRSVPDDVPIGVRDDRHVCVVAGTRSGKGTSVIVPNLCLWPGSVVTIDPTGDNATITASRRGRGAAHCDGMGQRVYVLDPYSESDVESDVRACFNPLDTLDPLGRTTVRRAEGIAAALVPEAEAEKAWVRNGARRFLAALVLHVLTSPGFEGRRSLVTVRELAQLGDIQRRDKFRETESAESPSGFDFLWATMESNSACEGHVAGIGEEMREMAQSAHDGQWLAVKDAAIAATAFINNPDMKACLSTSDFSLADLKSAPEGVSLFLVIPSRYMTEDYRWLRLMVTLITTELEAIPGPPRSGHPVLVVLDEFAALKRMESLEHGIAQIAKYGVKFLIVIQNLAQLQATYGESWEVFLSNCGVRMFFGVDDRFTREYVSELVGVTEINRTTETRSEGVSSQLNVTETTGESTSEQQSSGRSRSDSHDWLPLLRDSAGLFRKLLGSATASNTREQSTTTGQSSETGRSRSRTEGRESSRAETDQYHERPLVRPDEVGRYFSRLENPAEPCYPGLAVVLISDGSDPGCVRRVNYFEDSEFANKYAAHPNHPFDADAWRRFDARHQFELPMPPRAFLKHWPEMSAQEMTERMFFDFAPHDKRVNRGDRIGWFMTRSSDVNDAAIHAPVGGIIRAARTPYFPNMAVPPDGIAIVIETERPIPLRTEHVEDAYGAIRSAGGVFRTVRFGATGCVVALGLGVIAFLVYLLK